VSAKLKKWTPSVFISALPKDCLGPNANFFPAHSPDKPETVRRYEQVLDYFERILGNKKYVEASDRVIEKAAAKVSVGLLQRQRRPN